MGPKCSLKGNCLDSVKTAFRSKLLRRKEVRGNHEFIPNRGNISVPKIQLIHLKIDR